MNTTPPLPPLPPSSTPAADAGQPSAPVAGLPLPFVVSPLNQAQTQKRINKAKEDAIALRNQLWPEVGEEMLWLIGDKKKKGFSSMPRTMPILMNLIGEASKKVGTKTVPAGRAYLVLWCRVYGEAFVRIDNETVAASEAGYAGERAISTWREHMRVLGDLGFIKYKAGQAGPMQFVLLLNPYPVAKALRAKDWVDETTYTGLFQRAQEIGAGPDLQG